MLCCVYSAYTNRGCSINTNRKNEGRQVMGEKRPGVAKLEQAHAAPLTSVAHWLSEPAQVTPPL